MLNGMVGNCHVATLECEEVAKNSSYPSNYFFLKKKTFNENHLDTTKLGD